MRPGIRVGNYVIIEQIGQGGQAAVWSAEDEALKRLVAVKAISLSALSADDISPEIMAERFRIEARLIAELEHPNILPIYTFGQEGDELYLVMRYMAGGTLKKLIQQKTLDLARVITLARSIAEALDVAHQKNIVHRDIKSVNVLLDSRQNVYLADFGLSVTAGTVDASGVQSSGAGTLAYMSPEQMRSEPPDLRSDVYAFGILVFEMLTGSVPLVNNQPWNLQQLTNGAPLPVPASMSLAVAQVLKRATALMPEDRYSSAIEMVDDLARTVSEHAQASDSDFMVIDGDGSDDLILLDDDGTAVKPAGPLPVTDPAMLALVKANQMFDTALQDWADGAGRFRLYAEDFIYIDSFYSASDSWGVSLDGAARRMMLRAALEHGHNTAMWWSQVTDTADRRAVALQTLNSELPASRLRAMQYLSEIEDSAPPAIPTRVVTIVQKETDPAVRLAAVKLLEVRAGKQSAWRETAYSPDIDGALAELAAHDPDSAVREAAARTAARIRSSQAVTRLGKLAAGEDGQARQALVFARDEVTALPASVPGPIRRRVFILLSIVQFFQAGLVGRYLGSVLAFGLGWGVLQYFGALQNYGAGAGIAIGTIIGNAVGSGIEYAVLMGLVLLVATEPAQRLRAWTVPGRIILSALLGGLLATVGFLAISRLYYDITTPAQYLGWYLLPSFIFTLGFAIASGITRRLGVRVLAGAAGALAGLMLSWYAYSGGQAQDPVVYLSAFSDPAQIWLFTALWALSIGAFTFLPEILQATRKLTRRIL